MNGTTQDQATPGACCGLRVVSLSPSLPAPEDKAHSHTLGNLQERWRPGPVPRRLDTATAQPLSCLTCTCALSLLRYLSAKMSLMLLFVLCLRPVKDRLRDFRGTGSRRQTVHSSGTRPGAPRSEEGAVQVRGSDRNRLGKEKGQALRGCLQL